MKEAYNLKEHAKKHEALASKPEKEEKPKEAKKLGKEKKAREETKPKKDPHVRPLIRSHNSILVVIPSDIRDAMRLIEASEQNIDARIDAQSNGTILITLLGEPKTAEKAGAEGEAEK